MKFLVTKLAVRDFTISVCPCCEYTSINADKFCRYCNVHTKKEIIKKGEKYSYEYNLISEDGYAYVFGDITDDYQVIISLKSIVSSEAFTKYKYRSGFEVKKRTKLLLFVNKQMLETIIAEISLSIPVKKGDDVSEVLSKFKEDRRVIRYMKKYNLKFS